jgi:hypothetical protein
MHSRLDPWYVSFFLFFIYLHYMYGHHYHQNRTTNSYPNRNAGANTRDERRKGPETQGTARFAPCNSRLVFFSFIYIYIANNYLQIDVHQRVHHCGTTSDYHHHYQPRQRWNPARTPTTTTGAVGWRASMKRAPRDVDNVLGRQVGP